ncbi:unnamed protein product [Penicillium olsonii]|nr:unnamed protein product [Penicillium olsonii]
MPFTASDVCKIIFAIILPPLGVFLERGCGADLLINICLTILGWIPGIIHAMYVPLFFAPGAAADQIDQLYHLQILEIPYARIRDRRPLESDADSHFHRVHARGGANRYSDRCQHSVVVRSKLASCSLHLASGYHDVHNSLISLRGRICLVFDLP